MTSAIVTTGIDATKPAFGADAVSADIRDNMSAIKTQFNVAASEISALQTTVSDGTLAGLAALAGPTGFVVETSADVFTNRSLAAPAAGLTIASPAGVTGNPTFALANDLSALEALASNGFAARVGTDTWAVRTLVAPAAGLTIADPGGTANPTFALANDLAALEGLASTGYARRSGTDSWTLMADAVVSPVGRQTLWLPARSWLARTTNGAGSNSRELTSGGNTVLSSLAFDAASNEYAQLQIGMPKGWNEGTVTGKVRWTAPAGLGNVVWALQGHAIGSGDSFASATFGTSQSVTSTWGGANVMVDSPEFSAVTIAGTPAAEDVVTLQLLRSATDGSDTFTSDAEMLGVSLYITTDAATDA